jgi:dihydroflavonol-4-reductase
MATPTLVLVTGASGSIATAVCAALSKAGGWRVRGTVRDPKRASHLAALCPGIELVPADLESVRSVAAGKLSLILTVPTLQDAGWDAACAGCTYVLHLASPFVLNAATEEELVRPAVEGTKRVMAAALRAGTVKRVVVTSSVVSIHEGHAGTPKGEQGYVFTDADWSTDKIDAYSKSKTLGERAAWEMVKGTPLELVSINPSYVQGPLISARDCTSAMTVRKLMLHEYPMLPAAGLFLCDMRDVVAAEIAAMTEPRAAGQRYIIHSGSCLLPDIANVLAEVYKPQGFDVPTRTMPGWLVHFLALFIKDLRLVKNSLRKTKTYDTSKTERELGIKLHTWQEAILATAASLVEHGVVKPRPGFVKK